MKYDIWVGLAFLALVVAFTIYRGPRFSSHWLHLFRAFFPSWKFFEELTDQPLLLVRTKNEDQSWSQWDPLLPPLRRSIWMVFWAPQANLRHAYSNHLHHLVQDINQCTDFDKFESAVSYGLTRNLVSYELRNRRVNFYQFKLVGKSVSGEKQDLLLSPEYEVEL